MIQITDNEGRMLPAFRNLVTLVFCIVFFFMGWFGHMNWALRGEADQLVSDARESAEAREIKYERIEILDGNIENAQQIEQTDCSCGNAIDIKFQRELRKQRETGFNFNGTDPFRIHSD